MDPLQQLLDTEHLAHAYLIYGGGTTFARIKTFAQEKAGGAESSDALCFSYDAFGVDEARELSLFASLKPLGDRKCIVISFKASTTEAQNALLKVVEEGVGHSVFFFVVDVGTFILRTLSSRCVIFKCEGEIGSGGEAKEFLNMSLSERMVVVEELGKKGDREAARALAAGLLALFSHSPRSPKKIRDLLEADRYLKLSGSSIKSVLGHLALTL